MKYRMRVLIALAIGSLALAGALKVWADVSAQGGQIGSTTSPIQTKVVASDSANVSPFVAGNYILGFKVVTTTGVGGCTLYDNTSITGTVIDEITESTSGESNVQIWPAPYKLTTGLSVDVTTSTCIIYYY